MTDGVFPRTEPPSAPSPVVRVILDWTGHESNPPPRLFRDGAARYRADAHGKMVMRHPSEVDGICVHQTACVFGPAADTMKRHQRAFDIPIHAVSFRDGVVVLPYPALAFLWHGNGFNARSLGIEIEGVYPGVAGDHHTIQRREDTETAWSGHPDVLDDVAIATARAGLAALVAAGRALGCPITYVWAHRQATATRRADPGSAIWQHVVLEYAVAELGLIAQPAVTLKDGRPIPQAWDAVHGVGPY